MKLPELKVKYNNAPSCITTVVMQLYIYCYKEIFSDNKMITLPQLKALAKENKISCTYMTKDEIIAKLIDRNIIKTSDLLKPKIIMNVPVKPKASIEEYKYLKGIRNNPKRVEIFDKQTGETSIFTSTYKARRELALSPTYIKDGVVWKGRYVIKVATN